MIPKLLRSGLEKWWLKKVLRTSEFAERDLLNEYDENYDALEPDETEDRCDLLHSSGND